jgi:hypothetical protein
MSICTCHISNLRCKNERCAELIEARRVFKEQISAILRSHMGPLSLRGFDKKECLRAFRREINHRNQFHLDVFDEVARSIWKEEY